jgi:hypothetical protein
MNLNIPGIYRVAVPRRTFAISAGILSFSVLLSYIFQLFVIHSVCFTKLGIIFSGNLLFWSVVYPFITSRTTQSWSGKGNVIRRIVLGLAILGVNQLAITELVIIVMKYGYGCTSSYTSPAFMLFENNLVTSGLLFLILSAYSIFDKKNKNTAVQENAPGVPVFHSKISVKYNGTISMVPVSDILYIEAKKNTILLHTANRKFVIYQSLTTIEKNLDPLLFQRIHRSTIVNKSFIQSFTTLNSGNAVILLKDGAGELVMSRYYKKGFRY